MQCGKRAVSPRDWGLILQATLQQKKVRWTPRASSSPTPSTPSKRVLSLDKLLSSPSPPPRHRVRFDLDVEEHENAHVRIIEPAAVFMDDALDVSKNAVFMNDAHDVSKDATQTDRDRRTDGRFPPSYKSKEDFAPL